MLKSVFSARLKNCVAITLLSMLLVFPLIPLASGRLSRIWLIYDRNNADIGHSGTDPLAVRFSPPRIWLGMGRTVTVFKITGIKLYLSCDSQSAGFDLYVTDKDHEVMKSFPDRDPEVNGWYDVDLAGWTGYVDSHFFVEFQAHAPSPNQQETWATLLFDEAVIGEGEVSYGRSYRYTYGPDNPNIPAWLPIELTYPYGPGDLMIRVELEPQMPETVLPSLIDTVLAADGRVFKGYEKGLAPIVKGVLNMKIGEVLFMFRKGLYRAGLNKLENDIGPKLADPRPTPRTSWLHLYPEGSANQKLVTSFTVECQDIIQMAQKSVPFPPSLLEHFDFNGDGCDDLAVGVPGENVGGEDDAGAVNVLYGSPDGICSTGDDYWHQDVAGVKGECGVTDRFGEALAIGNFNGDAYDDLAIGVPRDEVDGISGAGAVNVLYGSASGLTASGDQLWHQNVEGIWGVCEQGDHFGASLAAGDFNGDGYDDLAIGAPGENNHEGMVTVLYGSFDGLVPYGSQGWNQDSAGILGDGCEWLDCFGAALTAGDFNGDDFDDLAIGSPKEDLPTPIQPPEDQGVVNVLYGSSGGLTSAGNQLWSQDSPGILDDSEWNDFFGAVLAAGDFNWDGYEDLVIGVPRESLFASGQPQQWAKLETGAINIIYGSSVGLTAVSNQLIHEEWCGDEFADYDHFGASLAVGDFDQDGYMDLAVGTPNKYNEHAGGSGSTIGKEAGAFYVICGSAVGFEWSGRCRMWYADDMAPGGVTDGVAMGGTAFEFDHFGAALSAGDFDGDWCCDLAIGKPGQSIFHRAGPPPYWYSDAGTVDVMYGSETGLGTVNGKTWHQNTPGVEGTSEDYDGFGSSLPGSHWLESYL